MHNLTDPPTSSTEAVTQLRLTALEHQAADLAARLQLADEQKLTLETRLAGLGADVELLHRKAFVMRTLAEMREIWAMVPDGVRSPAVSRPRRPDHLRLVGGSR